MTRQSIRTDAHCPDKQTFMYSLSGNHCWEFGVKSVEEYEFFFCRKKSKYSQSNLELCNFGGSVELPQGPHVRAIFRNLLCSRTTMNSARTKRRSSHLLQPNLCVWYICNCTPGCRVRLQVIACAYVDGAILSPSVDWNPVMSNGLLAYQ